MRTRKGCPALVLSSPIVLSALVHAAPASAACQRPDTVAAEECEPYAAMMLPSLTGASYFPHKDGIGPYFGGGAELLLFTWSNDADTFGPGQGKIRFDISGLVSGEEPDRKMVMYRGGVALSFERSAGRRYLIPYFSASVGGLYETELHHRGFADAGGGLYLVYLKNFIVDAEGSYLFPFTAFDDLAGPKAHLTVSFALW